MYKFEILTQFDPDRIYDFLTYVKEKKFNLYPNANENNTKRHLHSLIENSFTNSKLYSYNDNGKIIAMCIVRQIDWDSNHFGYKCASIDNIFYNCNLNLGVILQALQKLLFEINNDAILNNTTFMSVSLNSEDSIISLALQSLNYKYILTWVDGIYNSNKKKLTCKSKFEIGTLMKTELDYFKNLSSKYYYKGGRFYLDRRFDISKVNSMYSNLITSSYDNNDIMLSLRFKGNPIGLFICKKITVYEHFYNLKVAPLRYLIIDPDVRQKQIGYRLFAETINYLSDKCDIITSGLEVHNLPSLNLHIKLNFRINFTHNVYHWWNPQNINEIVL